MRVRIRGVDGVSDTSVEHDKVDHETNWPKCEKAASASDERKTTSVECRECVFHLKGWVTKKASSEYPTLVKSKSAEGVSRVDSQANAQHRWRQRNLNPQQSPPDDTRYLQHRLLQIFPGCLCMCHDPEVSDIRLRPYRVDP